VEPLLTTEQVAEWLQVDVVTVRRLVDRGEIAAYRVGGEFRFARKDVEEYLARVRVENPRRAARGQPEMREIRLPGLFGGLLGRPERAAGDRFDRFTERSRRVLTLAQEESARFNHNYIGTEHLLLGLLRETESVGARALASMGVEPEGVRSAIEAIVGRGQQTAMGEVGLTPRAKRAIELAVEEARRLGHHYVGTEHLLLGLVREGEGVAANVLGARGVDLEPARRQVVQILKEQPER
jgi:excisionase family DNA binding protein